MSEKELPEPIDDHPFAPSSLHPERPANLEPVVWEGPSAKYQSEVPRLARPKRSRASKRRKIRKARERVLFFGGIIVVIVTAWSVWDLFAGLRLESRGKQDKDRDAPSQLAVLSSNREPASTVYKIEPAMTDRWVDDQQPTPQLAKTSRAPIHAGGGASIEAVDKEAAEQANRAKAEKGQETLALKQSVIARLEDKLNPEEKMEEEPVSLPVARRSPLWLLETREATVEEIESCVPLFESYSKASDWREALSSFRSPRDIELKMEAYHADPTRTLPELARPIRFKATRMESEQSYVFRCLVEMADYTSRICYIVPSEEGSLKIDWESLVQYCDIPWSALAEERPKGSHTVRVLLRPDDFYAGRFEDRDTYVCFRLSRQYEEGSLYGYVRRGSKLHLELAKMLNLQRELNASEGFCMLEIAFPPDESTRRAVYLHDLVSPSWLDTERL